MVLCFVVVPEEPRSLVPVRFREIPEKRFHIFKELGLSQNFVKTILECGDHMLGERPRLKSRTACFV